MSVEVKKYLVLVVDDLESWRKLLTEILKDDFDVESAASYTDALNIIRTQSPPFHVVVTDMRLEDAESDNEDGIRLIEELNRRGDKTKAILITGYPTISSAKHAMGKLKASDYLEKHPSDSTSFDTLSFKHIVRKAAEEAETARVEGRIDVFVVMPFAKDYDSVYGYIHDVAETMDKVCERADRTLDSGEDDNIISDIHYGIQSAEIVIAELSDSKPNVFFEVGVSYALQKKVILIAKDTEKGKIPEILSGHRIIFYPARLGGEIILKDKLHARLKEKFSNSKTSKNISENIENSVCFVITSSTDDGQDTYDAIIKKAVDKAGMKSIYLWDEKIWHTLDNGTDKSAMILQKLYTSCLVVADLSWDDPTAFYLAGIAYGLRKNFKFLYRQDQEPPFDIRHLSLLRHMKIRDLEREDARNVLTDVLRSMFEKCRLESAQAIESPANMRLKTFVSETDNMSPSKVKVFLNHATEDKPLVRKLYAELKKYSWIDLWLDEEKLLPGQDWGVEIEKAMKTSDAVLVCMSNISVKKTGYVQAELRKAEELQKLRPPDHIFLIPVLLEKCNVPDSLQRYQWVDLSEPGQFDKLVMSLDAIKIQKQAK